jgi:hypothetical protein
MELPETESADGARGSVHRFLRSVSRRLFADRFLRAASVDLIVSVSMLAGLLALDRCFFPGLVGWKVVAAVLGVSLAVSALRVALGQRVVRMDAALAVDQRLQTRERLASAVHLETALPAGSEIQTLIARDAARSLKGRSAKEFFPVQLPRRAAWVLVPAAAALALALWLPSFDFLGQNARSEASTHASKQLDVAKKELDAKLDELAKEAERKGLPDARAVLELLGKEPPQQASPQDAKSPQPEQRNASSPSPGDMHREALVELSRREDTLRKALGDEKLDPLRQARKALENLDLKGPELTRKMQEALKEGDFSKAKEELSALSKELEALAKKSPEQLTAAEKQKLGQLSQELSKLSRNAGALSKLSKSLSTASNQLAGLEVPEALQTLEADSKDELERLSKLSEELAMLDDALELVKDSKDELAQLGSECPECGKGYCPDCGKPRCDCDGKNAGKCKGSSGGACSAQGKSGGSKSAGARLSKGSSRSTGPNQGLGQGTRDGGSPEATSFQRDHLRAKSLGARGVAVGTLSAEGPSLIGEPRIEKSAAVDAAVRELSEEVEKEPLPVEHRESIQKFHDLILNGGAEEASKK